MPRTARGVASRLGGLRLPGCRAWLAGCVGMVLVVCLAMPADARRPEGHFREGVQAADREQWSKVEQAMVRAIQADSQESDRAVAITGMRFEWYLPYHYLGWARFKQGDRYGARRAWGESRRQGVVHQWPDHGRFESMWNQVAHLSVDDGPAAFPSPPTVSPVERLDAAITEVERRLGALGPPRADIAEKLAEAVEALVEVEILRQANAALDDAEAGQRAERLEAVAATLDALSPPKRSLAELIGTLRDLIEQVRARGDDPAELADRLLDIEIELGRNQPDVAVLRDHEAALVEHLFPILAGRREGR